VTLRHAVAAHVRPAAPPHDDPAGGGARWTSRS